MCTYITESVNLSGSAKSGGDWHKVSAASVYFDHPVHAPYDHSLNVDVFESASNETRHVALELSAESARALASSILSILEKTPAELIETS